MLFLGFTLALKPTTDPFLDIKSNSVKLPEAAREVSRRWLVFGGLFSPEAAVSPPKFCMSRE